MDTKTNEQQVKEYINNDEQFIELSELIEDVAFNRRMYKGVKHFLWAKAHTLLIESGKDLEYVAKVIMSIKDD